MVPIPTGEHLFKEIVMDFIGELLKSEGFNVILVVTDQFTKVQYCILPKTTCIMEVLANFHINTIWKLCSLPRHNFRSESTMCLKVPHRVELGA